MKHIFQLLIILLVSFLGELLAALIPIPVPGSIYGMLLMLLGLCTKIIPLESVRETAKFLVAVMPIMFIAPAVGLLDKWTQMRAMLVPLIVITVVSTFVVMGVSGLLTQAVIRHDGRAKK
ncbi:MAG: CidA/LrgA family protein [Clostridia bacterium]|nr:CidA/LrgA family protein [Clostridia bacterium]